MRLTDELKEIVDEVHGCGFNQRVDCPKDGHKSELLALFEKTMLDVIGEDDKCRDNPSENYGYLCDSHPKNILRDDLRKKVKEML